MTNLVPMTAAPHPEDAGDGDAQDPARSRPSAPLPRDPPAPPGYMDPIAQSEVLDDLPGG